MTTAADGRRPTRLFGEAMAILAGDGLFAEAFALLLERQEAEPARLLEAARELAMATGVQGMVGGQYIDVAGTAADDAAGLRHLHEMKTGRLIAASIECVLLLDGTAQPATISGLRTFAGGLGVLFQIVDDILDVTRILRRRSARHRAVTNGLASAPTSRSSVSTGRAGWQVRRRTAPAPR